MLFTQVNPSLSCPDGTLNQHGNANFAKHASGLPAGQDRLKQSQSMYVINTKAPASGLSKGMMDTKAVYQQPPVNTKEAEMQALQEQYRNLTVKPTLPKANVATSENRELTRREGERKHAPQAKNAGSGGPRKVVIQASTAELLRCLGEFVCRRCKLVPSLDPSDVISWLQGVDRSLLMQGWQDINFIMPSSVVFVYMLCREMVPEDVTSTFEVQCIVLTCLYMSYSYMGNEISYPLRPFLIETERFAFWSRCCRIMDKMSHNMLRINNDPQFFTLLIRDLKSYNCGSRQLSHYPHPPPAYTRSAVVAPRPPQNVRPIPVGGAGGYWAPGVDNCSKSDRSSTEDAKVPREWIGRWTTD